MAGQENNKPSEPYTGSVVGFLEEAPDDDGGQPKKQPTQISHEEKKHVKATPMVRMLAKKLGVDIDSLMGTGPEGRVTREDVEKGRNL
ncbi:E3 binding domain-containing protein [Candidatus Woesearchaeota archaeon]|nr:E3 binding domain-containing protein [Candidatus Woesearchaeota archaeon]